MDSDPLPIPGWLLRARDLASRPAPDPTPAELDAERIAMRRARLVGAGCLHPFALAEVPALRGIQPPPAEWCASPEHVAATRACTAAAAAWLARPRELLLILSGDPGTGKSFLAAQLLVEALPPSRWVAGSQIGRFGEWWDHEGGRGLASKARAAGLLVLDELGRESDRYADAAAELIEERFNAGRRTVATSNLPLRGDSGSIAARYGARLLSRLQEAGTCLATGSLSLRRAARLARETAE